MATDHPEGDSDPSSIIGHQDVNKLADAKDHEEEPCDMENDVEPCDVSQSLDLDSHSPESKDDSDEPKPLESPLEPEQVNSVESLDVDGYYDSEGKLQMYYAIHVL